MLDHPGAIQVPTGAPKWPKTAPKGPRMAQNHQNGSKCHCMTPNDPKHFQWVYNMIICHVGPPWALFRGPQGPHNGPKQHHKWPLVTPKGKVRRLESCPAHCTAL